MRTQDTVSLVSRNLRGHIQHVALTVNGVIIGTAAVVILVSLGVGMQRGVMRQFEAIGDLRAIQVTPLETGSGSASSYSQKIGSPVVRSLDDEALEAIWNIPGSISVIPQVLPAGNVECTFQKLTSVANLVGLEVRDLAELGYKAHLGETRLKPGTVILGQGALNSFGEMIEFSGGGRIKYTQLKAEDILKNNLRFVIHRANNQAARTVELRVNGVLEDGSGDHNIYLRAADLIAWNNYATGKVAHSYSQVVLVSTSIAQVKPLAKQIEKLGFAVFTQDDLIERVNQTYFLTSILLGITGLTSLLMAGVGVANTMISATMEQTLEIGLWKALGATNREIMVLIASQAAIIGLLGGIGGTLVGLLGVWLFNRLGGMNVTLQIWGQEMAQEVLAQSPTWLLLAAPMFALVIGLLAGVAPAMHAAILSPIEALKDE